MSRTHLPFEVPKLRIANAEKHLCEAKAIFEKYAAEMPFGVFFDLHDLRAPTMLFGAVKPIPSEFSIVIGDAVHSLRVALDILANDLARLNGKMENKSAFPFSSSKGVFNSEMKNRRFHFAGPKCVDMIKKLEPWSGGNQDLYGLHQLDLADKHRLLVATYPFIDVDDMELRRNGVTILKISECSFAFDEPLPIRDIPDQVVWLKKPRMQVRFNKFKVNAFSGSLVFETAHHLVDLVKDVVRKFEELTTRSFSGFDVADPEGCEPPKGGRPSAVLRKSLGIPRGELIGNLPVEHPWRN